MEEIVSGEDGLQDPEVGRYRASDSQPHVLLHLYLYVHLCLENSCCSFKNSHNDAPGKELGHKLKLMK